MPASATRQIERTAIPRNRRPLEALWRFRRAARHRPSGEGGRFICFLGPSGCGKTTLLRAIAASTSSRGAPFGRAGRDISAAAGQRDYGIVFSPMRSSESDHREEHASGSRISPPRHEIASASLSSGTRRLGQSGPEILGPAIGDSSSAWHLPAPWRSRGLLLLDEPLSALDAKVRVHLRHEIKELQRKLGGHHDHGHARSGRGALHADRIVVMTMAASNRSVRRPRSIATEDTLRRRLHRRDQQFPQRSGRGRKSKSVTAICLCRASVTRVRGRSRFRPADIIRTAPAAHRRQGLDAVAMRTISSTLMWRIWSFSACSAHTALSPRLREGARRGFLDKRGSAGLSIEIGRPFRSKSA